MSPRTLDAILKQFKDAEAGETGDYPELDDVLREVVKWEERFEVEMNQIFNDMPIWVMKHNSKAFRILEELAKLQNWCSYIKGKILGELQPQ